MIKVKMGIGQMLKSQKVKSNCQKVKMSKSNARGKSKAQEVKGKMSKLQIVKRTKSQMIKKSNSNSQNGKGQNG